MASGHERYDWGARLARWVWSFALIYRSLLRALITSVALAAGVLLAGCNSDEISLATNAKANQPVPPRLIADMVARDMDLNSPILVRLFKQEAELEVWKQDRSGRFALLKTYPICRWSGDLGPKVREGDRQAPEGFYNITPAQMNPQSAYYLSFNIGYPNAFDKALGRTGSELMVHGDCSSRGCYAMTDEQIAEIYSLGRESFFGGQRSFQFQAYPFRMTPVNMAKHRNNPNMAFWRMLKEGYDHFEVTRQEPKVDVCDRHYVFDAQPSGKFSPAEPCPAYSVPQEIALAVHNKARQDEAQFAQLVIRGVPAVATTTGGQGGMNATFLAAVRANGGPGSDIRTASGTIPGHVHPPTEPSPGFSSARLSSFNSAAQNPAQVQVASAAPNWAGGVNVTAAERQASHPQRTAKTEPEGKPA